MSQQELLKKVVKTLERIGIPYVITGSVVSSLYGEPRTTHDIDIVVAVEKSKVHELVKAFPPPDFYLDEEGFFEAIDKQGMVNLINVKEGDKVDFWILNNELFNQSSFSRRIVETFTGMKMQVLTPEDVILSKLRWVKLSGGSEKQFTDALRVYEVQYQKLDMKYIEQWAKKLDVESLWKKLQKKAEIM